MSVVQKNAAVAYPVVFGDIRIDVSSVRVDGAPVPLANINGRERVVALHQAGRRDWQEAEIDVEIEMPDDELRSGPWQEVVCLAALSEEATNSRCTATARRGDDGIWRGTVTMPRARFRRRACLDVLLVGTVDEVPARLIGAGAADTEWFIDLMEAVPVRNREIATRELDFSTDPRFVPYADTLCIADATAEEPVVYINTAAVEGLMTILRGKGGSTAERLVRDLTFSQIAQDTWTVMFQTAISDLQPDESEGSEMPTGWHGSVLRAMLPDVMPGYSQDDALNRIAEIRRSGEGWADLQAKVEYAAAKRSQRTKKLTVAVRTVHRDGESA
ncbi:hypothetical protein [Nocardia sp. NPDC127526]|uniref:hypothetical protein n=1 Tax=Nocardia sp. NPDC127526 TaxID=3345393 RepID=UPI00363FB123